MKPAPRISVIIPTLDEAARLQQCLESVALQDSLEEVLVVDGGSVDGTRLAVERARPRFEERGVPLRWMGARRGRAAQMNAGAAASRGEIILFLHADTLLPPTAATEALESMADHRVGGAFRHAFAERTFWLRLISGCANLRSRATRCYLGDQAIFVRRDVFEELGGYPSIPIMEDLVLSRRLRRAGPTTLLAGRVRTSGRRFLSGGTARTWLRMIWMRAAWRLGADPRRLVRGYREVR
ncbi:MAG TPA: TIGR04283 family arsenosugar biosynthesis glycosyltransferase [Candidatus Polarisedimenticolia bacterium]|jgi:rSAM/selenodomain-associated transferase 2